ncbi:MAG: hypothetical protein RIF41_12155, partial [Polyangiaceae bacterium]
ELFEKAEAKAHSPVLLLYAARCHQNLGELIAARQLYKRVVDEPLGPDAPAPFVAAQKDAAADLEAMERRIPLVVIDRGAAPKDWRVTVDGVAVDVGEVPVDPGEHVVRAGDGAFERRLVIEEGARITVAIEGASKDPVAPAPAPVGPSAPRSEGGGFGASIGPGLIVLGVGAAGVGAGVALRVMALGKVSGVKERCDGNQCLAEDAAEIETAETFQTVSTVLFAVGGAAVATGIVLMIVLPEDEGDASLGLDLRPGYVGVQGRF